MQTIIKSQNAVQSSTSSSGRRSDDTDPMTFPSSTHTPPHQRTLSGAQRWLSSSLRAHNTETGRVESEILGVYYNPDLRSQAFDHRVRQHSNHAGIETLDEWPNVKAWLERIEERPAVKAGLDPKTEWYIISPPGRAGPVCQISSRFRLSLCLWNYFLPSKQSSWMYISNMTIM